MDVKGEGHSPVSTDVLTLLLLFTMATKATLRFTLIVYTLKRPMKIMRVNVCLAPKPAVSYN